MKKDDEVRIIELLDAISFGGAAVGVTYDAGETKGKYTKIGDRVLFTLRLLLTNKGSSVGSAKMGGLPFTPISQLIELATEFIELKKEDEREEGKTIEGKT